MDAQLEAELGREVKCWRRWFREMRRRRRVWAVGQRIVSAFTMRPLNKDPSTWCVHALSLAETRFQFRGTKCPHSAPIDQSTTAMVSA